MFDGHHNYLDYAKDLESWYYDWCDDFKQENMAYELHHYDTPQVPIYGDNILGDQSQPEATRPRTFKTPSVPTQEEIDEHNIINLPYWAWCNNNNTIKREDYENSQNITHIDYAFLKSDNDKFKATVLTMFVSTT
eukprot:5792172-Amphidinium_carterae.2